MSAKETKLKQNFKSDFSKIDDYQFKDDDFDDLPELGDEMLSRAIVKKAGRPFSPSTKKLISLRLPEAVIEKWKATGKGWQTRMAEKLGEV